MANPTSSNPQETRPRGFGIIKCIAIILLILIIAIGSTILVIWIVIRPSRPDYSVEDGTIRGFSLEDNHLNATFNLDLRSYNPNHRISIYYNEIIVSVWYEDEVIAFGEVAAFYQPRRNITRFEVNATALSVPLSGSISKDLKLERTSGKVQFNIRVTARARFKVGSWKSNGYHLRVYCWPVVLHLSSSSKTFSRTYCDVDL